MASIKDLPILIVDDDDAASRFSSATLRKVGFKNIIESRDLLNAWKIVTQKRIGLVMCEAQVNGKLGVHLLKKIRSTGSMARLPVLFTSTSKDPKVIAAHMKAGASGFLVKPFDAPTLVENLKTALTNKPKAQQKSAPPENAFIKKGYEHLESYNVEEAVKHFRKALKLNPKSALAYKGLAYVCKKRRDMGQFQNLLSAAAQSFIQAGQNAKAKQVFNEMRQYDTAAPNPFSVLGENCMEKEAYDDALRMFTLAIGVEPDKAVNYLNLARALKAQGKDEEALQRANEALTLDSELSEAKEFYEEVGGEKWAEGEEEEDAPEDLTEEEQREAVRFWVPDVLLDIKGYKDHYAITEMSPISVAFNPLDGKFKRGQRINFQILKLEEAGTVPIIKNIKGHVVRVAEENIAARLDDVTSELEEEIHALIEVTQEQQKEQFKKENKEIKFDIDMMFM